jgi:hypothetical protein
MLSYLEALTFDFEFEGKTISPVLIYAEPDREHPGRYVPVQAEESGYEGIACVDDTARAAVLALGVYEQTHDPRALRLAKRWLSFVLYMQYPDGEFANFVRNASGRRNASGPTSVKGGAWWTGRALWALARAYRLTGEQQYHEAYRACPKPEATDGKISALLALGEAELFRIDGAMCRKNLLERAVFISTCGTEYFRDHCGEPDVALWGYQQLAAVALAGHFLGSRALIDECRKTLKNLIEPVVRGQFFYKVGPAINGQTLNNSPGLHGTKQGLCAYCITPTVMGLAEMYRATGAEKYRSLALRAAEWFYGRNDARLTVYDPSTGLCADGLDSTAGTVSNNRGAESSIEAGLAELERRQLAGVVTPLGQIQPRVIGHAVMAAG